MHISGTVLTLICKENNKISLYSASAVQRCESDFTDQEYQELLPSLARLTASQAIKKNLTVTEIMAKPDISTNQRKAQIILNRHREHKAAEKVLNPGGSFFLNFRLSFK